MIGTDVEVTLRVNSYAERVHVGKLIGIADRASTANAPDLVLKTRAVNLVLVNTDRVIKLRSTMEINRVWDMNPMELARIAYETWRDRNPVLSLPEWLDVSYAEKEAWMACSEAVRDAVALGY